MNASRPYFLLTILALLPLTIACTGQNTGGVVCNTPYIRHDTGCCLDRDKNSICDNDEAQTALKSSDDIKCDPDGKATPVMTDKGEKIQSLSQLRAYFQTKDVYKEAAQASDEQLSKMFFQTADGLYQCEYPYKPQS